MSMAAGWTAVCLALLALVPSFGPGASSLIGLLASAGALALSLCSVRRHGRKYFLPVLLLFLAGVFFVNDSLRIWLQPMALPGKPLLYAAVVAIAIVSSIAASRLSTRRGGLARDQT